MVSRIGESCCHVRSRQFPQGPARMWWLPSRQCAVAPPSTVGLGAHSGSVLPSRCAHWSPANGGAYVPRLASRCGFLLSPCPRHTARAPRRACRHPPRRPRLALTLEAQHGDGCSDTIRPQSTWPLQLCLPAHPPPTGSVQGYGGDVSPGYVARVASRSCPASLPCRPRVCDRP